jgi:hypothetical protein
LCIKTCWDYKYKTNKYKKGEGEVYQKEPLRLSIKASGGGKGAVGRDDRHNKVRRRKQKRPEEGTVAVRDANIKAFNEEIEEIHEDMRSIITRQTASKAEEAPTTSAASAIIMPTT